MDDTISRQAAIDAILAVTGNSSVRELYEHVQEHGLSDMWSGGVNAAIDIIIAVPSVQTESKETSSTHKALDTISRQAAIDSMCELMRHWFGCDSKDEIREIKRELGKLPSAQPELIEREAYIRGFEQGKTQGRLDTLSAQPETHDKRTETHACDCISRQAAIDACIRVREYRAYDEIEEIKALPSAQPEPHWIPCSERLPDNRVDVLICYRVWQQYAKRYVYAIVNGWYARKHSVNENVFSEWEADCDYKEDEDEFYIHEGWYEFTTQGNGDLMNWYIDGAEVVAWMPLPEPYKEGEEQE